MFVFFPPTALAIFCQRSGVSLSYTARAFSKALFSLAVQEPELREDIDAICFGRDWGRFSAPPPKGFFGLLGNHRVAPLFHFVMPQYEQWNFLKGKKAICVSKGKKSMLDGDLEKTVRFLQEKNVGVVIRDERELNQNRMQGEKAKAIAICGGKENAAPKMLHLKWHLMIMLYQRPNAYDVNEKEQENAFNRGGPHSFHL
ncbi:hypothetical protein RHSIM_Rhsim02G0030400 [Rhododendron simsii]|uniref:Uncharacterized protein n=1 Tax=Rhododendron simsii TaxID=118357 RepID=A0A834HB53_RHOSS|nr:hypothetical protein RHSIM_Rhsim02G0030400 [Rhododendron simsii]